MYNSIKKSLKFIIPKQFLFKHELIFRRVFGVFYLGKKHECNVCNKKIRAFIELENPDLLCPFCGSLSRNRRLWKLLNEDDVIKGNLLHFSPSRNLFRALKKCATLNYFSTDFEKEFLADYKFDITNIDMKDDTFDTIICYHILEHVKDDLKAMKELFRVLKPGGKVYIQTPFKLGEIYEDNTVKSPQERLEQFGQADHVRIYSPNGLKDRLENCGFHVDILTFKPEPEDAYYGFNSTETVLVAMK